MSYSLLYHHSMLAARLSYYFSLLKRYLYNASLCKTINILKSISIFDDFPISIIIWWYSIYLRVYKLIILARLSICPCFIGFMYYSCTPNSDINHAAQPIMEIWDYSTCRVLVIAWKKKFIEQKGNHLNVCLWAYRFS